MADGCQCWSRVTDSGRVELEGLAPEGKPDTPTQAVLLVRNGESPDMIGSSVE